MSGAGHADDVAADWCQADASVRSGRRRARTGGRDEPASAARDHGKRNLWLAIAGGDGAGARRRRGHRRGHRTAARAGARSTDQVSKPPADALDNGTVPDVAASRAAPGPAGKVTLHLDQPAAQSRVTRYKWRVQTSRAAAKYQSNDRADRRGRAESGRTHLHPGDDRPQRRRVLAAGRRLHRLRLRRTQARHTVTAGQTANSSRRHGKWGI